MSLVLVVAAHPDDEVLGCGGCIARHAAEGDEVRVLIVAEGSTSRSDGSRAEVERLKRAAREAARILGACAIDFLGFPDNRVDTVPLLELVQAIETFTRRLRPVRVYTHHAGDLNIDHRRVHQAVVTAYRPLPRLPAPDLLFFEVPSSTEWQTPGSSSAFEPNWHVDISRMLRKKISALRAYSGELREFPHPRSIRAVEHLARWRGAAAGLAAAEAFMLGRRIEPYSRRGRA